MLADTDQVFHALADATRRDIVSRTLQADLSVSEISRAYPMRLSAVQKHVHTLEVAGLVHARRQGRQRLVRADPNALRSAARVLQELADDWQVRFTAMDVVLHRDTTS